MESESAETGTEEAREGAAEDGAPSGRHEDVESAEGTAEDTATDDETDETPERVRKYDRFKKVDRARYDRVNDFVRKRTYVTAREWAVARLCADFRTETGVEMTLVGENLPDLVPFMQDTYTPQAVNQARSSFEEKVRKSGATFLYGAMSGFFTTEELDDMMYEVTETARFLLEVEGVEVDVDHETEVEDRISDAMREIRRSSKELRSEEKEHECPECGHEF
jgi:hypothetical protein